eukprot:851705-Amphidinium_carterae.1
MGIRELHPGAGVWANTPLLVRQHLVQLQLLCILNFRSHWARFCFTTSAWGCSAPKLASKICKARLACSCADDRSPMFALDAAKLLSVIATS